MSLEDARKNKSNGADRQDRSMDDRAVTANRELSDADRIAMFRQQMFQTALPDLPDLPGYHVCWCTTTNPRDTIAKRKQLGYELIRPEDVPGYEVPEIKTGELAGTIAVNEMVAMKIPMDLYQAFMRIAHHDEPLREEGKLADTADFIRQQAKAQGADVTAGDGIEDMRKSVRAPIAF